MGTLVKQKEICNISFDLFFPVHLGFVSQNVTKQWLMKTSVDITFVTQHNLFEQMNSVKNKVQKGS